MSENKNFADYLRRIAEAAVSEPETAERLRAMTPPDVILKLLDVEAAARELENSGVFVTPEDIPRTKGSLLDRQITDLRNALAALETIELPKQDRADT